MHAGIPVGVHVLIERGDAVLLMRRAGTGFFDGQYSLPGGHVEPGESIGQTAIREMQEETGLHIPPDAIEHIGVVHRLSDTNRIDFFVRATRFEGEPRICEPGKCDGLVWVSREELPQDIVPYVRTAIGAGAGPWLLELGW
jgi:ADP-ribose pyrophosphatase YjhB (NUDIX family)